MRLFAEKEISTQGSDSVQAPSSNSGFVWLCAAALSVVVFLVYLPTLRYGLVFDDKIQIIGNYRLTDWKYFPGYFTTHLWAHYPAEAKWYRPLFLVWLRLCYVVFGPPASIWHLPTVLAHVASTVSVFVLLNTIVGNTRAAFAASLVFGIHPIHTEAVAWISAVEDPLVTCFLALSLYFFVTRKAPISILSLVLALCAMLTKEVGVVAICLIFAYEWIYSSFKNALIASVPYAVCTAFYFALRFHALGTVSASVRYLTFSQMVLTWPRLLATYAAHLVWPVQLSVLYEIPVGVAYWPLGVLAVVILLTAWALRKAPPAACFGTLWFVICMLPSLAIWYFNNDFIHDRYLYLASVGLSLILASLLVRVRFTPPVIIAAMAVIGALSMVTIWDMGTWRDDIPLYERAVQSAPHNTTALNNLALGYMAEGRLSEAIVLLQRAIAIDPRDPDLYVNLGSCYQTNGEYAESERVLRIADQLSRARAVSTH